MKIKIAYLKLKLALNIAETKLKTLCRLSDSWLYQTCQASVMLIISDRENVESKNLIFKKQCLELSQKLGNHDKNIAMIKVQIAINSIADTANDVNMLLIC